MCDLLNDKNTNFRGIFVTFADMKSLPPLFIEQIESYNDRSLDGLTEALTDSAPSVSVRINRRKPAALPDGLRQVPWCPEGRYLDKRPVFTFDPAMHQGRYYVQDASSMIISEIVRQLCESISFPILYLDACAAPGGKTTAAIDALPEGSLALANEYDYRRAEILKENLMKWGYPSVMVSRGDTARMRKLRDTFQIVAADVPCSGEGMFRKDDEAIQCWSPELVAICARRQREIIDNLWGSITPGGYFIYSTCTFNRSENEEMVDYIVSTYGAESVAMNFEKFPQISGGIDTPHHCYRFMPHRTEGEGLFVAVLRRPGELTEPQVTKPPRKEREKKTTKIVLPQWTDGCDLSIIDDTVYATPVQWTATIRHIASCLDTILRGVETGAIKGRDIVPSQALAMSACMRRDAFPTVDVDRETALTYLRRETIELPESTPRGFILLTYENVPLGFVKNIGNRSNNLYPAQWRILRKT